ncbi:MAG: hypothetical protein ACFNYP_01005 [Corynebacterium matruchotii]|uniref:hypothetical protein n=1 Tax=Corynebacterium matruchotii TaxID=43768 RepID=UPI00361213E0
MSNPLNVGSGVFGSDGGESNGVSESGVAPRRRLRVGKPVLVVVGVVLVVVAGVVGYLVFGHRSTVTEVNTTAKNAEIPLLERYSTANQFLPEKLLAVMQKCNGKADEYNKQITVPVYKCSVAYDEKQILSGAQIRWVPGADAETARNELESGKATRATDAPKISRKIIREASGSQPEVGMSSAKGSTGFVYFYYPRDEFTVYLQFSSKMPSEDEVYSYVNSLGIEAKK